MAEVDVTARAHPAHPARRPGAATRLPRWAGPLLLLVVLAVALAIGGGAFSSRAPTPAERAASLDTQIRCPSCEDLSVAQSSAPTAIAVRHQVSRMVAQGASDDRILDAMVARYGPSILLRPPASGLTALVWIVPAVAGALAVAVIGGLFWRRARAFERLRSGAP